MPPATLAGSSETPFPLLPLVQLAERLEDLMVPPGNRLERLKGKRAGQSSIRINDQWRICFVWTGKDACNAEIVDYH
jgi:toxin HigB-1